MNSIDPRKPWLVFLIVLVAILACSLLALLTSRFPSRPVSTQQPVQAGIPSEASLSSPTIIYQSTFEPAPCAFPVPPGYNPECGYLVVPENRTRPDTRQIRLHVAIFRSRAATPAPDPVVKLAGGPGSSALDTAGYLLGKGMDAVLDRRDFVVFDQRGTGYSQPRLDCPERTEITPLLLNGSLAPEQAQQAIVE